MSSKLITSKLDKSSHYSKWLFSYLKVLSWNVEKYRVNLTSTYDWYCYHRNWIDPFFVIERYNTKHIQNEPLFWHHPQCRYPVQTPVTTTFRSRHESCTKTEQGRTHRIVWKDCKTEQGRTHRIVWKERMYDCMHDIINPAPEWVSFNRHSQKNQYGPLG
jgi:hypothetical protein